jgi:hypothetical protein
LFAMIRSRHTALPWRWGAAAALLLILLPAACDGSRKEREAFYGVLKAEFRLAAKRLDGEEASTVALAYRKRMSAALAVLKAPAGVWEEYRRTLIVLRFYEAVEGICGKDKEERNTSLPDISLAAVSHGYTALDGCQRLYLFAALYRAMVLERLAALPEAYDMDEAVREQIKGAAGDPDCLVRAGYLFLEADEMETLRRARSLLESPETLACGLGFVGFLEPGDIDVALSGVGTIVESKVPGSEKRDLLDLVVGRLGPLMRSEGEAVLENLETIYRTKADSGRLALLLMSLIDEPWDGGFWEEVAMQSPVPEERELAVKVLAGRKGEGLSFVKRMLQAGSPGKEGGALTEPLLMELVNMLMRRWKSFPPGALADQGILQLLKEASKGRPLLSPKVDFLDRLLLREAGKLVDQEAAEIFSEGVGAIENELKTCWKKARQEGIEIPPGARVSARMGEEGDVLDVATEETGIPSEEVKACIADAFRILSFNTDVFEEDQIVTVQLTFPGQPTEDGGPGTPEAGSGEQAAKDAAGPGKPAIGKIVVGGGQGVGIADVRKGLAPHLAAMAFCAAASAKKGQPVTAEGFSLKAGVTPDGGLADVHVEGEGLTDVFRGCVKKDLAKARIKAPSTPKVWVKVQFLFSGNM